MTEILFIGTAGDRDSAWGGGVPPSGEELEAIFSHDPTQAYELAEVVDLEEEDPYAS